MTMRRFSCFMMLAAMLAGCCVAAARDRKTGLNLSYNELSATFSLPMAATEELRLSLNLDMTGVVSGKCLYPGLSADVAYLYVFGEKVFESGERMEFFAGPGANAGYVRNFDGRYGVMAALSGHIGFEYVFNVPVSLSLSLEPALGIHVNRDRFGYVNTDLYKAGLAHSLLPHVGIMYHF